MELEENMHDEKGNKRMFTDEGLVGEAKRLGVAVKVWTVSIVNPVGDSTAY